MSTEGRTVTNYVRGLEAEVERLREALEEIATARPRQWTSDWNAPGELSERLQRIARVALADEEKED